MIVRPCIQNDNKITFGTRIVISNKDAEKEPKNMEELKKLFTIVHQSPNDTIEFG